VQKDILASKLVESNPSLLETARLNSELCNIVKCQLCEAVGSKYINLLEVELCDAVRATQRVNT
jgi:hypothetical protein